ncbi:unnamed protein product [Brugia timori]|uniref:Bm1449 n=2 Tax=Brugia TaxID=6278 RepID=A0A1I9G3Z4_BRUMA|nr:Bm1449 [Brugia malayi]VDO40111.1 unnamed protein product [Brugia timori]
MLTLAMKTQIQDMEATINKSQLTMRKLIILGIRAINICCYGYKRLQSI